MKKTKGILAIVLHAHLPYIRHPDKERVLEELWLYEAITETYLPLLSMFERFDQENVPCRITMSITPTLGSMFLDPLLQARYVGHLQMMLDLSSKELERTRNQPEFHSTALMYRNMFKTSLALFEKKYKRNLLRAFAEFQNKGLIEIIASCATHGYLPLMDQEKAIDAQVSVGAAWYRKHFHRNPEGFWLPECGYSPFVEESLHKQGIKYVILDTHGVLHSIPKPRYATFAPVLSQAGIAFFGRDVESSKQVWSSTEGYPGDHSYRDFYRDIGYDLDYDYVSPYFYSEQRGHTGIKYYSISGQDVEKRPYCGVEAKRKAAEHAGNFMFNRQKQVEYISQFMDREPIIIAPYDAELFGHWWFEGPQWLEFLVRKIAFDQTTIKLGTPGEYLKRYPVNQVVSPSPSSWGNNGYSEVWLDDCNDWIYRHLSRIAADMSELATIQISPEIEGQQLIFRALNQAAREVLLAQSSDWAFIMKADTFVGYASERTKTHVQHFRRLQHEILTNSVDENYLSYLENRNNIFPDLDYRVFRQHKAETIAHII